MRSDPQDEQSLPESRDGEPLNPDGVDAGVPPDLPSGETSEPASTPPSTLGTDVPTPGDASSSAPPAPPVMPPRMPAPPQMPGSAPSVPTWGATPVHTAAAAPDPGLLGDPQADEPPERAREGSPGSEAQLSATEPGDEAREADLVDAGVSGPGGPANDVQPVATPRSAAPVVAPVVQGDWLASVCPYLASEDGTYRSASPDAGHRCIAVDPPATLPLAFQERFCLTDRHPRCEMYKYAQEVGNDGGIPVAASQLQVAATRPVRSADAGSAGAGSRRSVIMAAIGVGGIAILVLLVVLLMGSCSSEPAGPGEQASSGPVATDESRPTAAPQATPTPERDPTPQPDPDATPNGAETGEASGVTILYEIQEGEALLRVSETFGISRRRILRDNPELEEVSPSDLPGMVIQIAVPADMPMEEVEALPGYQGIAP